MTSTVLKFADETNISSNLLSKNYNETSTLQWNGRQRGRCNSTPSCVKSCMWATGTKEPSTTWHTHTLEEVEEEKYLGVLIHRTISVSNNCAAAVSKANQMAGHVYRNVTPKSVQTVVPLYKTLVRSHLVYCSLGWSPYLKKDNRSIDRVQRRVTKMIPSICAPN